MSKKSRRRAISPRKPRLSGIRTGSKQDNLVQGYKPHENALQSEDSIFIPKIK